MFSNKMNSMMRNPVSLEMKDVCRVVELSALREREKRMRPFEFVPERCEGCKVKAFIHYQNGSDEIT